MDKKSIFPFQPHQIQVGYQEAAEDEEEEPSLHLLSHRNSLERHWPMAGVEGELELEEEEDATPREGSLYTPSTGESLKVVCKFMAQSIAKKQKSPEPSFRW